MINGEQIDLEWLLEHRTIQTYFQPIVSIRKQEIVGLEALSRGRSASNDIIMPQPLFAATAAKEKSVELDRLCREKALENYKIISAKGNDGFLFLNLDTSIIDKGVVGSGHLIKTVQQLGLNPSSIVIEIVESKIHNTEGLTSFINAYKQYGNTYKRLLEELGQKLSDIHPLDFEYKLREIAKDHTCVQCYYILDINGTQITETVKAYFDNKGKRHGMFRPDFKGSDQSFKDYYIFIHAGFEQYISEPYISLANGLPCLTGSLIFKACNGHSYILCIDFSP